MEVIIHGDGKRKVIKFKSIEAIVVNNDKSIFTAYKEVHECSFGFGDGNTFSEEKEDWVCSCGKTRREYLAETKGRKY